MNPITPGPKSSIIHYLFREDWPPLSEYLSQLDGREHFSFLESKELVNFSSFQNSCLVLCSIKNKHDLLEVVRFIKGLTENRRALTKLVVVNFSGSKAADKIISDLGIQDVLFPSVAMKTFKFKMDFWLKALDAVSKYREFKTEKFQTYRSQGHQKEEETSFKRISMAPLPENELADVSKTARRVSRIKRGDKEYPCVLDDFHETTFIFRLVGIEILVSEVVELEVSLEYRDVQTFLKGFGKVLAIEESENESYLTVQVEEALIPQVERLQEVYQERQLAINEFLSTARGR